MSSVLIVVGFIFSKQNFWIRFLFFRNLFDKNRSSQQLRFSHACSTGKLKQLFRSDYIIWIRSQLYASLFCKLITIVFLLLKFCNRCYHFWISLPPCNQIHHYPLQLFWNVMTCTHSNCNTDFVIWKKYHSDILIFNIFSAVIIKFNRNFDIIISVLDPPPSCHHLSKFCTTTPIN